jgi:hypothetical protein
MLTPLDYHPAVLHILARGSRSRNTQKEERKAPMTVVDHAFERLIDSHEPAQKIATGFTFTEGPAWHSRDRCLIFSDTPADTLYRWTEAKGHEVFRRPSGQANGNTFDRHGRLVTCEHANRRITRTAPDGAVEVVASHYDGKRLNSPNDVICAADGRLALLADDFVRPNGLAFSAHTRCNSSSAIPNAIMCGSLIWGQMVVCGVDASVPNSSTMGCRAAPTA